MGQKLIDELKKKAKADYERKLKELEVEYQKNIDAISRVSSFMNKDVDDKSQVAVTEVSEEHTKANATSQEVREIIERFNNQWSVVDVRRVLADKIPPRELSKNVLHNVIKQKREKGEIKTVKEGVGRRPAIYETVRPVQEATGFDLPRNDEDPGSTQHPGSSH